jgi:hypothetical protein
LISCLFCLSNFPRVPVCNHFCYVRLLHQMQSAWPSAKTILYNSLQDVWACNRVSLYRSEWYFCSNLQNAADEISAIYTEQDESQTLSRRQKYLKLTGTEFRLLASSTSMYSLRCTDSFPLSRFTESLILSMAYFSFVLHSQRISFWLIYIYIYMCVCVCVCVCVCERYYEEEADFEVGYQAICFTSFSIYLSVSDMFAGSCPRILCTPEYNRQSCCQWIMC